MPKMRPGRDTQDFGKLIPGHGGMLDRVCSIIFVLPVTFLFFKLFYGI